MKDKRSEFANDVCKLLLDKYDYPEVLKHVEPIYNHFMLNVRNIYELIPKEIPLFYLYELIIHGKENFDLTEGEYLEQIEKMKSILIHWRDRG